MTHPAPAPAPSDGLAETFVLLDNSVGQSSGQNSKKSAPSLLFTDPVEIVSAETPEDVPQAIAALAEAGLRGLFAAGFFSYELGYVLEPKLLPLLPPNRAVPLLWFGLYHAPQAMTDPEVDAWLESHLKSGTYAFSDVTLAWDRAAYKERFTKVQENIRAGDIYQLNLTFKARFRLEGSPLTFYRDLRRRQRVAYAGIVDTGRVTILSASPELFIDQRDGVVETRPMKGTAPRAGRPEADAIARRMLSQDEKQRAENLMIVDLMRNDLGRLAEIGGVSVTDLFTVETFRTLHQMTSGVRAKLKPETSLAALLAAIFPPGSIVGAPKIRAMELIRTLETEARGVYCGAMGYLAPRGVAHFNVAIRSPMVFRDGTGEMGIGSGVVWDSAVEKEYDECLLKMKFLTDPPKPFALIETLLYEPDTGFWLLDHHMRRLVASARYFAFVCDEAQVRATLAREVTGRTRERLRVRLLLAEDGGITVTLTPQPAASPEALMRYVVSPTRVASGDVFLFHKTTRREVYDREHAHYAETYGADEVVYLNEREEVTEGSRTNIFVKKDGRLLTSPLDSGLLPGTLRAELLRSGQATESPLKLADLEGDAEVYLGNSVRGLMPARRIS